MPKFNVVTLNKMSHGLEVGDYRPLAHPFIDAETRAHHGRRDQMRDVAYTVLQQLGEFPFSDQLYFDVLGEFTVI